MKKPKNFEEGIFRLETILDKIRDEETPLNESLKMYSEAAALVAYCNTALESAQLQIQEIDNQLQEQNAQEDMT